jgi:hypothetical protein
MCDPTTVVLAIGVAVAAAGAAQQAAAASKNAKFQSQVAKNNATIAADNANLATARAEVAAADILARGRRQAGLAKQKARQLAARQTVQLAAGGQALGEGSAAELTADTEALGELDALTITNNAEREAQIRRLSASDQARGLNVQASNFTAESQLQSSNATNAKIAGAFDTASTLATGAAGVNSKWQAFKDRSAANPAPATTANAFASGFNGFGSFRNP